MIQEIQRLEEKAARTGRSLDRHLRALYRAVALSTTTGWGSADRVAQARVVAECLDMQSENIQRQYDDDVWASYKAQVVENLMRTRGLRRKTAERWALQETFYEKATARRSNED